MDVVFVGDVEYEDAPVVGASDSIRRARLSSRRQYMVVSGCRGCVQMILVRALISMGAPFSLWLWWLSSSCMSAASGATTGAHVGR